MKTYAVITDALTPLILVCRPETMRAVRRDCGIRIYQEGTARRRQGRKA